MSIFENYILQINREEQEAKTNFDNTVANIKETKVRHQNAASSISTLQAKINQQEARKCTPW